MVLRKSLYLNLISTMPSGSRTPPLKCIARNRNNEGSNEILHYVIVKGKKEPINRLLPAVRIRVHFDVTGIYSRVHDGPSTSSKFAVWRDVSDDRHIVNS